MAILNSNKWEILVFDTGSAPAANAPNATFMTVGHATSVSFSRSVSNIVVTSKISNSNAERIAGQKDSSGSVGGYTDLNQLAQPLQGIGASAGVAAAGTVNVPTLSSYIDSGVTLYLRIGEGLSRFTVPALASGLSTDGGVDGVTEYTFDWEQAGAAVYDADVTA